MRRVKARVIWGPGTGIPRDEAAMASPCMDSACDHYTRELPVKHYGVSQ